ncbi:MAG TPA: hypothetical protein VER58_03560 [Thermoanaerobaculia bacterium]|nr:hypothetical protein [Thermoanaerobaculia bacterium]
MQRIAIRVLITLVAALSSIAQAESLTARKPWHAAVAPPRPGLPAVTIDLGYPSPYVPQMNSPITLKATAADVPFDGYIGFRFAVQGRKTLDTPVIARARLRPHEGWSFQTTANLRRWGASTPADQPLPREIVIEWRDRSTEVIARQAAEAPPWTTFYEERWALRVIEPSGQLVDSSALGSKAYVERVDGLSDRAQWYAGFSSVVIPLTTWLDLPKRVREAIFGSGVYVVFVGLPRQDQQLDILDKALLPIVFTAHPGSYEAPWPYRGSRRMPAATPMSWIAKQGAAFVGAENGPYIARTQAAAWVADEVALSRPLPAMFRFVSEHDEFPVPFFAWEHRGDFLRVSRATVLTGAALLVSICGWFLARRKWSAAIAFAVVLLAIGMIGQRDRIRPAARVFDHDLQLPGAPGIIEHFRERHEYGAAPLGEAVERSDRARTSLTGDYGSSEKAEARSSPTAPSMGLMIYWEDWDAVTRWSYRREIRNVATISDRVVVPLLRDFHGNIAFFSAQRPIGRDFRIVGSPRKQPDGRLSCAFALGSSALAPGQVAVLKVGSRLADSEVEMAWAGGTIKLTPTQKDIYSTPSCLIPPAVFREIAAQGGIVNLTIIPKEPLPAESFFYRTWIEVQEKKS